MRKGLSLAAIALALLLGTACGGRPQAQARYVYYPGAGDTSATSVDTGTGDTLPGAGSDDPVPVDYVNAAPAAAARPAPPPGPVNTDFGARNAIGRVEIPKIAVSQPIFEGVGLDVLALG